MPVGPSAITNATGMTFRLLFSIPLDLGSGAYPGMLGGVFVYEGLQWFRNHQASLGNHQSILGNHFHKKPQTVELLDLF